ncbi:MAG: triose-phosphate isomerase [Deltaproteobacteria bacterium]|nr:MAG: triose-phosphate isomerase [Deltaproteobacteria bacterium]
MARVPFIAGNWKLNLGPAEAGELAEALASALADRGEVEVAVFPTALSALTVAGAVEGSGIEVGLQEIHSAASGAFTGTNSARMAREAGLTRVLIGHSERRQLFGETDAGVRAKVELALAEGLLPIVCVGETLEERDAGQVEAVVHRQVAAALEGLEPDQVAAITLAYEPVWAIGTGRTATPAQAQEVHASIRGWLRAHFPAFVAEDMRIQYGGSVKPGNAAELLACEDIDGALVGGASLKADSFAGIVAAVR